MPFDENGGMSCTVVGSKVMSLRIFVVTSIWISVIVLEVVMTFLTRKPMFDACHSRDGALAESTCRGDVFGPRLDTSPVSWIYTSFD